MAEEKPKPAYYGILPASVRYDKSLHPNAKIIYTEISSLCNKEGYCWASNSYFADLFNVTDRSIINWINNLREKNYIKTQLIFKNGSKEIKERRIYISDPIILKNLQRKDSDGGENNFTTPGENPDSSPGEENFTTGGEKDFTSPGEEKFQPGENNFTHNNKPLSRKDLSLSKVSKYRTLEECEAHAEKEKYQINVPEFHKYYYGNVEEDGLPKMGMAKLMMSWAKKPGNFFAKSTTEKSSAIQESTEIKKLRDQIKGEICRDNEKGYLDHSNIFAGKPIEKTGAGYKILVSDERALRYEGVLKKINVIVEVK